MGILKAFSTSVDSVLRDQYKEYFYSDMIPYNALVVRGRARKGLKSQNRGDENVITKGSIIVVNSGEGVAIVSQGTVSAYITKPGEYVYSDSAVTGVFSDGLVEGTKENLKEIGNRFSFGGITPMTQRIYYFNLKEIFGNVYETQSMPVRVVDEKAGIDIDVSIRCSGKYTFRIVNPKTFYQNVCGNIAGIYYKEKLCEQLTVELLTVLPKIMVDYSAQGIRFYELTEHTQDIVDALNRELSETWRSARGIELVSVGLYAFDISAKDLRRLNKLQALNALQDIDRAKAALTAAQAESMVAAANNSNPVIAAWGTAYKKPDTAAQFAKPKSKKAFYYRCNKCGHEVSDETKQPKFCPDCGDPFDAKDIEMR